MMRVLENSWLRYGWPKSRKIVQLGHEYGIFLPDLKFF